MATVVHCKRDQYDVYIGRGNDPATGKPGRWGNPYRLRADVPRGSTINSYKVWLWAEIQKDPIDRGWSLLELAALDGKVLGCWCKPHACHGDVLAAAAAWAKQHLASEGLTLGSEV